MTMFFKASCIELYYSNTLSTVMAHISRHFPPADVSFLTELRDILQKQQFVAHDIY